MSKELIVTCLAALIKSVLGGFFVAVGVLMILNGSKLPMGSVSGIVMFAGMVVAGFGFSTVYSKPRKSINFLTNIGKRYAK